MMKSQPIPNDLVLRFEPRPAIRRPERRGADRRAAWRSVAVMILVAVLGSLLSVGAASLIPRGPADAPSWTEAMFGP